MFCNCPRVWCWFVCVIVLWSGVRCGAFIPKVVVFSFCLVYFSAVAVTYDSVQACSGFVLMFGGYFVHLLYGEFKF